MKFKRWCRQCDCEQEMKPVLSYIESWQKLFWLLEFLRTERIIEEETFTDYVDHLLFFKRLAFDADEEIESNRNENH